ncbi:hydroxymethylbilane synthase [Amycolatopsis mediterranei S699]|uniref:Porphobilinogen deaminase n=2 Tax=Amycolatopsis mediterranei TaxID=33910 RepID=A0A0H3CUL7_AMYMU|nr:hydroxymethylbilane synthase [Amycolatopsis mediterranei]ADJ42302.1 hydroxymethylbilane synthase [Amycolatopsis mediterranei U32]AEK38986.1 porphobilinogen deaminase [Amycolatopsis mediterranei S699]AFO74016.1 hydroxymethylbilane synthase [Amycolatopsis mediterranei S699]AGT81145.1 hydroxymethylbilane synthase [Amycolatopsis mediterranei RB]UZF67480.1 hydroxymethylbilane synthase [Amycolatopsis mediterranei]
MGTRGSKLALTQTGTVADALRATGVEVEIVKVTTPGDKSLAPIATIGVGVFTSALREALLRNEVDVIVHSYKDLPTAPEPGITLAAVPPREDPRDALIARDGLTLGELPPGSTVGTGAARRTAQLRALGLGLEIVPIRGNIDTRMRKVTDGELDAVVLARAGLARVGLVEAITETLDPIQMLPAPAQGALAVECRSADVDLEHLLRSTLDDEGTRAAVTAERALLAALEAGCSAPVGALAEIVEDLDAEGKVVERISLRGTAAIEGEEGAVDMVRAIALADKDQAAQLGKDLAAELLDLGAGALSGPAQ